MAKVSLPLTASSTLATVELDAKSVVAMPFANQGITAESAPVLLSLEANETVDAENFAARMVKSGGHGTLAQARLFVNAGLSVVEDLVDEYGAVTVQTPMGTIETFISGTIENPQDQPDPVKNYAFLALVVPEPYRKLFAQIETYVPTSACPAAVKRVRDKQTNQKGICGATPFYLEGRGMTFGSPGETLELLTPLTFAKVADVAVDAASKSEIQFLCTLPSSTAVAAGSYVLRLTTLAGGTVPWPLDLDVSVLTAVAPPGPTLTKTYPSGEFEKVGVVSKTNASQIEGEGLETATVKVTYTDSASTVHTDVAVPSAEIAATDEVIVISDAFWAEIGPTLKSGTSVTFKVTVGGGTSAISGTVE